MGCCGGGYNSYGSGGSCHGGRGFNLLHICIIVGIALLILKAVL